MLLPLAAWTAELRIDHVTVAGQSLPAMRAGLEKAGLKLENGAIASFPDGSYIELIAGPTEGACAWTVRPRDFDTEMARLQATGLKLERAAGNETRPDGTVLQWETASAGDAFFPILIRDATPRDKRAFPSGKASNRDPAGVLRVVIAVHKIADAFDRFHAAYPETGKPLKQVDARFGAQIAWVPDSPVIFAEPLGPDSWVAARIEKFGEGPCAFVLSSKKGVKAEAAQATRWFGRDLRWLDTGQMDWRLGVELQ